MAITYDQANNKITVTGYTEGTPCNFNNLYTADIGATNGRDLLDGAIDADPNTFSLDSQPAPADSLAVPLKITCTARAGATCDIAGTDAWGNALTENGIDISSGSATTTKRFATVDASGITVSGMTNGDDFDVKQDRWGVVRKQGNRQFRLDCDLQINTWFADIEKEITVDKADGRFFMNWGGVFKLGTKISNYGAKEGCTLIFTNPHSKAMYFGLGRCLFYDSVIDYNNSYMGGAADETNEMICCTVKNTGMIRWKGTNSIIYRLTYVGGTAYGLNPIGTLLLLEYVFVHNRFVGFYFNPSYGDSAIKNLRTLNVTYGILVFGDASSPGTTSYAYIIDSVLENWNFSWAYGYYGDSKVYRQYTFNLKVTDKDNNNINNATVTLWDKNDNQIFSVTTSSGVITEQTVSYGYYNEPNGGAIQLYSPHTLQISKAGYQTYKKKFALDEKIDWRIALKHSNVCVDQEVMIP